MEFLLSIRHRSKKGKGIRNTNGSVQNRQGDVKNRIGSGEAKERICMTHGHELRGAKVKNW